MVSDRKMYDCICYVNYLSNITAKYPLVKIAKQMNTQQYYGLTNHLDNTLTVTSDRKRGYTTTNSSAQYYPFSGQV